jgi:hypothetical protein
MAKGQEGLIAFVNHPFNINFLICLRTVCVIKWWPVTIRGEPRRARLLGIPTGDVLIFAHRRVMRTDTIFNVVRQIAYIHGRESILLEIRERIQKYM